MQGLPSTDDCICCEAAAWGSYGARDGYPLRRCRRCGFVQALLPPGTDLDALYDADYFGGRGFDRSEGIVGIEEARNPQPALVARRCYWLALLAEERPGKGLLLDVGCGPGPLLDVAAEEGWVVRQDISPVAVVEARRHGHDVILGQLETAGIEPGTFDVATMVEVIEHVRDPRPLLATVREVVADRGALLITTGDVGSPRARLRRASWSYVRPPGHLSYFTKTGIELLLRRCGFASVRFPPTFNVAFPTLPGIPSSRPGVRHVARLVRRTTRGEMLVLARV